MFNLVAIRSIKFDTHSHNVISANKRFRCVLGKMFTDELHPNLENKQF